MKVYILKEKNDATGKGCILAVFSSHEPPPERLVNHVERLGYTLEAHNTIQPLTRDEWVDLVKDEIYFTEINEGENT
jgi:hypothetical protein